MKKTLLTAIAGLITIFGFAQITATDFTANDCTGNSHTLFTELDAGKVVVITWVMPCITCIKPASIVANTTQGYASSNPGRVKFYLVDDYADTPCTDLVDWATQNSISANATFSNTIINPLLYGGFGGVMQKTIILGGVSHTVFFNVNGAIPEDPVDLRTAIVNALAATSGVVDYGNMDLGLNIFPSPAASVTKINYTLNKTTNINIDLLNVLGEKINYISVGIQSPGKHEYQINIQSLMEGVYFAKLNAGESTQAVKFSVVH